MARIMPDDLFSSTFLQNGMNLPFSPEESPIIDSHTDSKEKDSKFSKSQSDRVPEQQSNENVSQPMNTFKEETSDHSGESEDSSNSDRERRVAPFPQVGTFGFQ